MMEVLIDGQMDKRMDIQNSGRYKIIPMPLFVVGHKNRNEAKC